MSGICIPIVSNTSVENTMEQQLEKQQIIITQLSEQLEQMEQQLKRLEKCQDQLSQTVYDYTKTHQQLKCDKANNIKDTYIKTPANSRQYFTEHFCNNN